jgi:hypothetical protein
MISYLTTRCSYDNWLFHIKLVTDINGNVVVTSIRYQRSRALEYSNHANKATLLIEVKKLYTCIACKHMLDWHQWWALRPDCFTPWERAPITRLIKCGVGPRTDMHTGETTNHLLLLEIKAQSFSRPAHTMVTIPIMISWEVLRVLSTLFCRLFLGLQQCKYDWQLNLLKREERKRKKEGRKEGKKEKAKEKNGKNIHIYIRTYSSTYIRTYRCAHIPGASSPWRLNFVRPQYGTCCMSPFWSLGFFRGSRFKKKCPPVYILITKALSYLASLCAMQLFSITTEVGSNTVTIS